MGHLYSTVKYLLKDLESRSSEEEISLTIPPGVSIFDWKSDLRYLNKRMISWSDGGNDLISLLDKDLERLFNNPKKKKEAYSLIRKFYKLAEPSADYENWKFSEEDRGFVNIDKAKEKIVFSKGSKRLDVARELWRNLNKDQHISRVANRAMNNPGNVKRIEKEDVRKVVREIEERIQKEEEEHGYKFPYEFRRPIKGRFGMFEK